MNRPSFGASFRGEAETNLRVLIVLLLWFGIRQALPGNDNPLVEFGLLCVAFVLAAFIVWGVRILVNLRPIFNVTWKYPGLNADMMVGPIAPIELRPEKDAAGATPRALGRAAVEINYQAKNRLALLLSRRLLHHDDSQLVIKLEPARAINLYADNPAGWEGGPVMAEEASLKLTPRLESASTSDQWLGWIEVEFEPNPNRGDRTYAISSQVLCGGRRHRLVRASNSVEQLTFRRVNA